jgi:hypothetical protein
VNFLTDRREGKSTLRLADVRVNEWIGEKHVSVDRSFCTCGIEGIIVGHATF